MSDQLLGIGSLPVGFSYPPELERLIQLEMTDLEPWKLLTGDSLRTRFEGLRARYPARTLIPIARRMDSDDLACFDLDRNNVAVIHDFASPGWEARRDHPDFRDWFHSAINDMFDF